MNTYLVTLLRTDRVVLAVEAPDEFTAREWAPSDGRERSSETVSIQYTNVEQEIT